MTIESQIHAVLDEAPEHREGREHQVIVMATRDDLGARTWRAWLTTDDHIVAITYTRHDSAEKAAEALLVIVRRNIDAMREHKAIACACTTAACKEVA